MGAAHVLEALPTAWSKRELFIDNLQVRNHFIIVMSRWTGLVPWEVEFRVGSSKGLPTYALFAKMRERSGPASLRQNLF